MITKLTDSQLDKLKDYRDKWINIGLSTTPVTLERAIEIIHPLQTELLGRKATPVVLMNNPLDTWLAACLLAKSKGQIWSRIVYYIMGKIRPQFREQVMNQVDYKISNYIHEQAWFQAEDRVRVQIWDQIIDHVEFKIMDQAKDQVKEQVRNPILDQVSQVGDQIWEEVMAQTKDFIWPWIVGQWGSGMLSFYDFFFNETNITIPDELRRKFEILKATAELGIVYPLEHVAVVCQKPKTIHKNEHGLHREGGMAVEYEGWGFYALNGVRVPKYLAMTPSEHLDIQFFHNEENADVRTEFVRKYGVERMLSLGKKIDSYENYNEDWWTKSEYELWDMATLFPNLDYQPYLKMLNQTTKIWHVEAVSPNCRTLRDAIKERFGGRDFTIKAIA